MYPQPSMDSPRMAGRVRGKVIREYNVPPAIHGQSKDGWKGTWKSYPRIQCTPAIHGQSEDGLKHSYPRIEGNVPPAIHRQSEQREREGS